MKAKQNLLSTLICFFSVLIVSLLVCHYDAYAYRYTGNNGIIEYGLDNYYEMTITGVVSPSDLQGEYTIPEKINGYPVTKIAENAFE